MTKRKPRVSTKKGTSPVSNKGQSPKYNRQGNILEIRSPPKSQRQYARSQYRQQYPIEDFDDRQKAKKSAFAQRQVRLINASPSKS